MNSKMTALDAITTGNMGLARIILAGWPKGERVRINAGTAPTPSGDFIMWFTIEKVIGNNIYTRESEPYFGYNCFNIHSVVG